MDRRLMTAAGLLAGLMVAATTGRPDAGSPASGRGQVQTAPGEKPKGGGGGEPLDEAMRAAESRREAMRADALAKVASGDPLEAFLALDKAMELAPADAELLAAKKKVEAAAVEEALKRAGRMSGEGDEEGAVTLLARMRGSSGDPRLPIALRHAREGYEAALKSGKIKAPKPNEGARGGAGEGAAAPEIVRPGDGDSRELERRVQELERRLDRITKPSREDARAEPGLDSLERRMEEGRKDAERTINELRRDVDRLTRDVQALQREVDRLRSRP